MRNTAENKMTTLIGDQATLTFSDTQANAAISLTRSRVDVTEPNEQGEVARAETVLLQLADYIYAHTSLKPMSKTLFLLSRCLLLARKGYEFSSASEAEIAYEEVRRSLGVAAPLDDFSFGAVVREADAHVSEISGAIQTVAKLSLSTDSLGLVFNTLLRGKFEGGEGLGTYLTPEEVAVPMVEMAISAIDPDALRRLATSERPLFFGDICGGTGRFVYAMFRALLSRGIPRSGLEKSARLFDQSSLAVGMARLNFLFDNISPEFSCVHDSLIEPAVSELKNRFVLLATNPPFGTGKYHWNAAISEEIRPEILHAIGLGTEDSADPAELFVFRNLDLLAPDGVLAIVLPDGVLQSRDFVDALHEFERSRSTHIEVIGIVSLPSSTFALGGTVAKTSFVLFRKNTEQCNTAIYFAHAHHVGFVKRGNRRVADPDGNDLILVAREFGSREPTIGVYGQPWHSVARLTPAAIMHQKRASAATASHVPLSHYVSPLREYIDIPEDGVHYHVSILDVDETGLINIVAASANRPISRSLRCRPGDLLVSCINPAIWRATVVPEIEGGWSCSPEFAVLRPREPELSWALGLGLHRGSVMAALKNMAGGTSSSRQRVEKDRVLELVVPDPAPKMTVAAQHAADRVAYYKVRLRESRMYETLHDCEDEPEY
jgi:type I restriction-modification system DNA methylase subunit